VKPFALALVLLTGTVVSAQSPELYSDPLFAIPADYVETKPSEALMKSVVAMGLTLSYEARQQIANEGAELDKRYRDGQQPEAAKLSRIVGQPDQYRPSHHRRGQRMQDR
jgi:hypothetical protein